MPGREGKFSNLPMMMGWDSRAASMLALACRQHGSSVLPVLPPPHPPPPKDHSFSSPQANANFSVAWCCTGGVWGGTGVWGQFPAHHLLSPVCSCATPHTFAHFPLLLGTACVELSSSFLAWKFPCLCLCLCGLEMETCLLCVCVAPCVFCVPALTMPSTLSFLSPLHTHTHTRIRPTKSVLFLPFHAFPALVGFPNSHSPHSSFTYIHSLASPIPQPHPIPHTWFVPNLLFLSLKQTGLTRHPLPLHTLIPSPFVPYCPQPPQVGGGGGRWRWVVGGVGGISLSSLLPFPLPLTHFWRGLTPLLLAFCLFGLFASVTCLSLHLCGKGSFIVFLSLFFPFPSLPHLPHGWDRDMDRTYYLSSTHKCHLPADSSYACLTTFPSSAHAHLHHTFAPAWRWGTGSGPTCSPLCLPPQ